MERSCMRNFQKKYSTFLIIAFVLKSAKTQKDGTLKLSDIAPKDYDYLHPPNSSGGPIEIDISIDKLNIRSIDESDMLNTALNTANFGIREIALKIGRVGIYAISFSVTIELWQVWDDFRLKYPPWASTKYQVLDSSWINKIWNPKLYFINSVDGKLDNIITPSSFFWISDENRIFYFCRVILKLTCAMDLKYFPHDEQKCSIEMGSAIYTTNKILLVWRKNPPREMQLFELQQYEVYSLIKSNFLKPLGPYNVSCLQLTMTLRRRSGYYLINVYIPTVLIVIMSMLTFWIPYDAVPARVTLGVTSLLTIITKQYQASMPSVSYIVALNVWLSCCIGFVFFSLLEFAAVIALSTSYKKSENSAEQAQDLFLPMVMLRSNGTWSMKNNFSSNKEEKVKTAPKKLDYISRIVFPVAFIAFCITYWKCYN